MSLLHRLFGSTSDATVLCGRCERALDGHDAKACERRMSRRFFFGVCAGAGVAAATIPEAVKYIEFANGGKIAVGTTNPFKDQFEQAYRELSAEMNIHFWKHHANVAHWQGRIPIRIDPAMPPTEIAIEQRGVEVSRIVNLERRG